MPKFIAATQIKKHDTIRTLGAQELDRLLVVARPSDCQDGLLVRTLLSRNLRFKHQEVVELISRPWPKGKTAADMRASIDAAIGRTPTPKQLTRLRDAIDDYLLGMGYPTVEAAKSAGGRVLVVTKEESEYLHREEIKKGNHQCMPGCLGLDHNTF